MSNLTAEQNELLNTTFSPEMEKEAAAQAALISDLYSTGFSKIASAAADEMDKEKKEDKDEPKELKEEHEKEASDRGAFIARGYIDGLIKEGSERHGDEMHYLVPFIAEKLAMDTDKVKKFLSGAAEKAKGHAAAGAAKAKEVAGKAAEKVKTHPKSSLALAGVAGYGTGRAVSNLGKKKDDK